MSPAHPNAIERQLTSAPHGHVLTNCNVFCPDGRWIVFDTRSDPAGAVFDGTRIAAVHVNTGEVRTLYESRHHACCGVATFSPASTRVAFILGPEHPTPDWSYNAFHRQGVIVDANHPGHVTPLDARDLTPPYTPGALRGGTHVHIFDADGQWLSHTYEDHVLAAAIDADSSRELNQRNIAVSAPLHAVRVPMTHPRNHHGSHFSVLVTRTHDHPTPGSDQIRRAVEDAWVGSQGYLRADETRQRRAIAFQGEIITAQGAPILEAFIVDLPDDITQPAEDGPLQGTMTQRPRPPRGCVQRRLTFTQHRRHPGLQGPRHWLRSSPDGGRIGCLMKDDAGVVQLFTVSPRGGEPVQVTRSEHPIESAFTWSADGRRIAAVIDGSVCIITVATGRITRLTEPCHDGRRPRPEACVLSPDGRSIAFVRHLPHHRDESQSWNQVCLVSVPLDA